jgi:hypothetical protein
MRDYSHSILLLFLVDKSLECLLRRRNPPSLWLLRPTGSFGKRQIVTVLPLLLVLVRSTDMTLLLLLLLLFDPDATLYEDHDLDIPIDVGPDPELSEMDVPVDSESTTALEPVADGNEFPHGVH